uniref:Uncharacterized protein n=2 Tax=Cacopsylla melanoneura TaxID=428564 RepID=A0A8D8UUC0_9HEMI
MQVVHKSSMACLFVALLLLMSVNPFNSHRWYQDCQWSIKKEIGTVQQPSNQMNRIQEISHEESGHQINRMRRDNEMMPESRHQIKRKKKGIQLRNKSSNTSLLYRKNSSPSEDRP